MAACYTTEAGIRVCAPVHDALMITAPLSEMDEAIAGTQRLMLKASTDVLDGFPLRTDVDRYDHPRRYRDKRGIKLWTTIWEILGMDPDLD